jgi:hypothetical protein
MDGSVWEPITICERGFLELLGLDYLDLHRIDRMQLKVTVEYDTDAIEEVVDE